MTTARAESSNLIYRYIASLIVALSLLTVSCSNNSTGPPGSNGRSFVSLSRNVLWGKIDGWNAVPGSRISVLSGMGYVFGSASVLDDGSFRVRLPEPSEFEHYAIQSVMRDFRGLEISDTTAHHMTMYLYVNGAFLSMQNNPGFMVLNKVGDIWAFLIYVDKEVRIEGIHRFGNIETRFFLQFKTGWNFQALKLVRLIPTRMYEYTTELPTNLRCVLQQMYPRDQWGACLEPLLVDTVVIGQLLNSKLTQDE